MKIIEGEKSQIENNIREILDEKTIFLLEKYGIPKQIAPLGGTEYEILKTPYLNKDGNVVLGINYSTNCEHYLIINTDSEQIYHQWNHNEIPNNIFINSSIEKMMFCDYSYTFFLRRLILAESLGSYYDNSSKGGNFEKYAGLLFDLIFDIDKAATEKGVWHSLINEMKLGVI